MFVSFVHNSNILIISRFQWLISTVGIAYNALDIRGVFFLNFYLVREGCTPACECVPNEGRRHLKGLGQRQDL